MNPSIQRVNDPETGEPFRQKSLMEKFVGYCWERFAPKALAKISIMLAPLTMLIAGMFSTTPHQSEAIGIGLSALAIGIIDFARSWIEHKMKWFPQKSLAQISEEQQAREQPAIPFTGSSNDTFTRSAIFNSIINPPKANVDRAAFTDSSDDVDFTTFRKSLIPVRPSTMPTQAELDATAAKMGKTFEVEINGAVQTFPDRFTAIAAHQQARYEGTPSNLLF